MQKGFLAIVLFLFAAQSLSAQTVEPVPVEEIETAYRQIEYERAEALARQALQNYAEYTVAELAAIHSILALIAYNRGQQEEARRQFLSALQLTPQLELDPVLVPPKILTYFADLKAELAAGTFFPSEAALRYVLVRDPRLDAAMRSLVAPGWGQYYKGQDERAGLYAALFGLAAGAAVFTHFKMRGARERYEDATKSAEAERRYGTYNRLYRTRNGLAQGALIVWLASYVDALLTRTPEIERSRVELRSAPGGVSVNVRF